MANPPQTYKPPKLGIGRLMQPPIPPSGFGLGLRPLPPASIWLEDKSGHGYRFLAHRWMVPEAERAVYGLGDAFGYMFYIGKAKDLQDRISGHEKLAAARRAGANTLWVHVPGVLDPVNHLEAEKRLIDALCPPLNVTYNPLSRL